MYLTNAKRSQNSPKLIPRLNQTIFLPNKYKTHLILNAHLIGTNRANAGSGSDILHPLGYLVLQIKINLPLATNVDTFFRPDLSIPMSLLLAHDFPSVL